MNIRKSGLMFIIAITLFVAAAGNEGKAALSLTRQEDPVELKGAGLAGVTGSEITSLSVMRFIQNRFEAVPFQVDECHPDGTYAYLAGEEASRDSDPAFDINDELVFMAGDLGDRVTAADLPDGITAAIEIQVTDPLDRGRGWAYLIRYPGPAPRSPVDYVSVALNPEQNRKQFIGKSGTGEGFIMGAPFDTLCPDELRFISGGEKYSGDILDKLKIRGRLVTRFLLSFNLKLDSLIKSRLLGYTDGRVRVIYNGSGYFKLGFIEIPGQGIEYVKAYRRIFNERITFSLPFTFDSMLKEFPLMGRMDFNELALGYQLYTNLDPSVVIILDGQTSQVEQQLDFSSPCSWIAGYGLLGGLVFRMYFLKDDPEWNKVSLNLYLNEDSAFKDKPEDHPGELAAGIDVQGMEKLKAKGGTFNASFYFFNSFSPGDEKKALQITDYPLQTECKQLL